jgi:acetyl/propionyl-CoA carboxylase alpha subunit
MRGAAISGLGGVLMQHAFVIAESEHEAWLSRHGEGYALQLGDEVIPVALAPAEGGWQLLSVGAETSRILIATDGDLVHVHLDGSTFTIRYVDPVQRYGSHAGGGADDVAEAPMPGVVIAVHVKEGQPVSTGDTLMVIESMKLETAIKAWREGAVAAVHVGVGQAFQRGAPLLSLAPQSGA